ncbi:MAG: hypothetical protein U9R38_03205 [Candidatus Margulisiibacteriota bacterium]|nr:hypothetical protein [Candidatus Margulisiibacteriota bacterium]
MSIKEIEKRIIEEASAEAAALRKEHDENLAQLEKMQARQSAELKAGIIEEAKRKAEEKKRALIVPARLSAKKALLEEKQKILGSIYKEIKKEKEISGAELVKLREDSEVKAAKILYG